MVGYSGFEPLTSSMSTAFRMLTLYALLRPILTDKDKMTTRKNDMTIKKCVCCNFVLMPQSAPTAGQILDHRFVNSFAMNERSFVIFSRCSSAFLFARFFSSRIWLHRFQMKSGAKKSASPTMTIISVIAADHGPIMLSFLR